MDEIQGPLERIVILIKAWCEFGVLCVHAAIMIPFGIAMFIVLLVLPIAYLIFAAFQPLWLALYLFAVFGGVAAYMYLRPKTIGYEEDPHAGRAIISEERAVGRSKSRINPESKSIRRSK